MSSSVYRLHPVTVGEAQIDGIYEVTPTDGIGTIRPPADGNVDPYFIAVTQKNPGLLLGTFNLKAGLDVCGFAGVEGAVEAFDALVEASGEKSSSGAVKYELGNALVVPRRLVLPLDDMATLQMEAMGYDGPLNHSVSQTLSAFTPGSDDFYGLGPTIINGTTLEGVQRVEIDFGFDVFRKRADGTLYPVGVRILQRMVTARITLLDPDQIVNLAGGAGPYEGALELNGTTGFTQYARKRSKTGYVANATAAHLKIVCANGLVRPEGTSGSPRSSTAVVEPVRGSTGQCVITTATAIT